MATIIGIMAQQRNLEERCYHAITVDYIRAIESTGAIALIVPCTTKHLGYYLDACDGFVFPGGEDIDPTLYGQEYQGARHCLLELDQWLLDTVRKISEIKKPILGICKGMQLLNVAHGGTLTQDIAGENHHNQWSRRYECIDTVKNHTDGFLSGIFGDTVAINSIHHQAVHTLGTSLQISAISQYDGEIEAIEHQDLPQYGIQWHPEYLDMHRPIFQWFIEKCRIIHSETFM